SCNARLLRGRTPLRVPAAFRRDCGPLDLPARTRADAGPGRHHHRHPRHRGAGAARPPPGWARFGQALPQGAAAGALKVGTLATQTDVKTTWPDGSIRFAVVTVKAPSSGTYAITAAAAGGGTFTPSLPTASVTLAISGQNYVA